jgi:hypothetical protein
LTFGAGSAPTFSVFMQSSGAIAFAPASSRILVRFEDPNRDQLASTSVAVRTP